MNKLKPRRFKNRAVGKEGAIVKIEVESPDLSYSNFVFEDGFLRKMLPHVLLRVWGPQLRNKRALGTNGQNECQHIKRD